MKKRAASIILSIALAICAAMPFIASAKSPLTVYDGEKTQTFRISSNDITQPLSKAFEYCEKHYNDNDFTVVVPEGEYTVTSPVTLCDNTTLDLSNNVVIMNGKNNTNIFIGKRNVTKYNGTADFNVIGGTLTYVEDYAGNSCQIRIAHGKHISFKDTVFENNYNSHNVEIAGCYDVSFEGCTFKNASGSLTGNSGEALQIDILEEDKHFSYMPEYDGTMNKNIKVNKCTFSNLLRGLGTNSAFAGLYQKNIKVTNCTFSNIISTAINCTNYIDVTIKNNVIADCGEGIKYSLMMTDSNLDKMNYIKGKGSPVSDCNTIISNNDISVNKNKYVSDSVGINIFGNNITKSKNVNFKTGNYYVGNIKVKHNTVNTDKFGIRMYDVRNSHITNNTVTGNKKNYGILMTANSKSNRLYNNSVKGFEKGIYSVSGNDNIIKSNKLEKNNCGIYFSQGIKAFTHYNSYILNNTNGYVEGKDKSYTFSNLSKPELTSGKTATIKWKKVKKAEKYQIYRSDKKDGSFEKIATLKSSKRSFKDKKAKKGKNYYYKIRANRKLNGVINYSSYSNVKEVVK